MLVGTMIASRGADAELHAHLLGHAERAEDLVEHRHDERAAADAEQAGENPRDDAADDDREREPDEFADRHTEDHVCSERLHAAITSSTDLSRSVPAVGTSAKRIAERLRHRRRGLHGLGRQMPAEGARARHAAEQAEHMARDGMQPRAARKLALDIGDERLGRGLGVGSGAGAPNSRGSTARSRHGS